ncbi:MAG: FliA/WhiG family RNA polymerase sigma factor [Acidobacteria bacterium]|nr:FliA/WhiG family RNA polymerase sigma factor [Acidobacteriota bacterium]
MSVAGAVIPRFSGHVPGPHLEEMVNHSLPGVRFVASRLANRLPAHVDVEDLIQVGVIGLLQSAHRFDPERGVKFQTFANRRVEGAMLDYLRSLDWRPRSVRQRNRHLRKAIDRMEQQLGEAPTEEDVATEIGLTAAAFQEWKKDSLTDGDPLSRLFWDNETEENAPTAVEAMADPADSPEVTLGKNQMQEILADAVDRLPGNERMVLTLYYYEHLTMREIGQFLGVKQGRVSQLHSQAIRRLRIRLQVGGNTGNRRLPSPPRTPHPQQTQ